MKNKKTKAKAVPKKAKGKAKNAKQVKNSKAFDRFLIAYALIAIVAGFAILGDILVRDQITEMLKPKPSLYEQLADATVMLIRSDMRGGGSGVILSSSEKESVILTNAHVCLGIGNNAKVFTRNFEYKVAKVKIHNTEDVCMVLVKANLKVNTKLASESPKALSKSIVSGHPLLNPLTITEGHFSDFATISIMDLEFGPRMFFSRYLTNLISPGSSGSGVYNEEGELVGLIFAGRGMLAMGFMVPFKSLMRAISDLDRVRWASVPTNANENTGILKIPKIKTAPLF